MRNAILSGVEQTKRETQTVQSVVKDNLAIAKRIESNVKSVLDESDRVQKYLKSKSVLPLTRVQYLKGNNTGQESVQERKAILTWISTLDFRDKQRSTFSKHHQGTGKWLLDSEAFKQWFKGPKNSTLWCPGIRMKHSPVI